MYDFGKDMEAEAKKLDEKIKKLKEKKANLKQKLEDEKQQVELARKVGLLVTNEFKGKKFEYKEFLALVDKHFISDFEREFFELEPLTEDDPRRPRKRTRKKKAE